MVRLRLRREGKKGHPIYKLVATDKRSPRDGRFIEVVGQYDPNTPTASIRLNEDRITHWLKNGAQASDTVRSLLRRTGFWLKWTLSKQGKDEATISKVTERWTMQQADRAKRESDRKNRRAARKNTKPAAAESAPAETPPAA